MARTLTKNLTSKISVEILPVDDASALENRVWAINWFNYKRKWLYGLYNRLAVKHVIQAGGRLVFKGHNQERIYGDKSLGRDALLVVTYPKIDNFLEMLTIKAFQLISLLRVKAVKDFVFGFVQRTDSKEAVASGNLGPYLVWHYRGSLDNNKLNALLSKYQMNIFFHGGISAQLKRKEQGKEDVMAPFIMDGILLINLENSALLVGKFIDDEEFKGLCAGNKTNYVAIFERVK